MLNSLKNKSQNAWLLTYGEGNSVLLPMNSCQEVIESPVITIVPDIAYYGLGLMDWQERWLPVVDLDSLVSGHLADLDSLQSCVVISYLNELDEPVYAALKLVQLPKIISVTDDDLCALPENNHFDWKAISTSCIRYQNSRVPIIQAENLFSRSHVS